MAEPRWLDAEDAARHLSLRIDAFLRMVRDGRIPPCSRHLGPRTARWEREALDARMRGGTASSDTTEAFRALADKEARSGGAHRAPHASGRLNQRIPV